MGPTRSNPPRTAPVWLWLWLWLWLWFALVSSAFAQDLPPLPGEVPIPPPRPVKVRLEDAEPLRLPGDDLVRSRFVDPAPIQTPIRTQGVPAFEASDFPIKAPAPKPEPPAPPEIKPAPPAPTKPAVDPLPADAEPAAVLSETKQRLDKLPRDDAKDATPASKALRAALEERLNLLKQWDEVVKERQAAEDTEHAPEKNAAEWKADLERVTATLAQTAKDPDALLPASFRGSSAVVPESDRAEMKEAIDAAQAELKEWSSRLEQARAGSSSKPGASIAAARARRDKSQQELTGLKARNAERETALAAARTPDALATAREALTNGQWEARIEAERLRTLETVLATETRRSELSGLNLQVLESHAQLAQRTLDRMRQRYQAISVIQERDLHRAAVKEQTRADHSGDPLERYRAQRTSELLELEARVLINENAQTTNPPPTEDQQRALAERADADFANIKLLLDDGKVSRLDALRLNNDFRRLGAERSRIVSRDLAVTAARLTTAENALSEVELEMVNDSRDDRFELDNLLEHVPAAARPRAEQLFREFETKHLALLARRRLALDKLAKRADDTHQQVVRRLRILDDHYGFIRTHMFWVRDEDPVGGSTLVQARRDLKQLGRAFLRVGAEVGDRSAWGRLSAEFLAASIGLMVLPLPLRRAHQALRSLSTPAQVEPDV